MKIFLLQDVKKVGRRHEIKDVSDGYARNFLIVKKLAMPANEKAFQLKAELDAIEQSWVKEANELADRLKNESLEFVLKTGPKNEIFGSVKKEDIQKMLADRGIKVEVALAQPLKQLGEHLVEINFGREMRGRIRVILKSSEQR